MINKIELKKTRKSILLKNKRYQITRTNNLQTNRIRMKVAKLKYSKILKIQLRIKNLKMTIIMQKSKKMNKNNHNPILLKDFYKVNKMKIKTKYFHNL